LLHKISVKLKQFLQEISGSREARLNPL